jgi:hypothetical protein
MEAQRHTSPRLAGSTFITQTRIRYTPPVSNAAVFGAVTSIGFEKQVLGTLRTFENAPPVQRNALKALLDQIDHVVRLLELNWSSLPVEIRSAIKLGVYELSEHKPTIRERLWAYVFLFRFASDKGLLKRYFTTVSQLDEALYRLVEQDDPRFREAFDRVLESHSVAALGVDGRSTKQQWSEWLQRL